MKLECAACNRLFSGMSTFDRHQSGMDPVVCHDPADRDLVCVQGVWRWPPSDRRWWPEVEQDAKAER